MLCLSAILALLAGELVVRMMGHYRWTYSRAFANEPTMHEPDPVLGWRNKEGRYEYPAYVQDGESITMTILADGRRVTSTGPPGGRRKLVFIGGSYVRGSAISDDETFAWKIQERYSSVDVVNLGTGAYGTYQSLLLLERFLSESPPVWMVLYGFTSFHERRNVASSIWMRTLAHYSSRGLVSVPYVTIGEDGELMRHPPARYRPWPLAEYLASVDTLQERLGMLSTRKRATRKREATKKLLSVMRDLCGKNDARFGVVLLGVHPRAREEYTDFLHRNGITVIDCVHPLTPEMSVPGEGHPNARLNALWADCIGEAIGD